MSSLTLVYYDNFMVAPPSQNDSCSTYNYFKNKHSVYVLPLKKKQQVMAVFLILSPSHKEILQINDKIISADELTNFLAELDQL